MPPSSWGQLLPCDFPAEQGTRAGLLGSQGSPHGVLRLLACEMHLDSHGGQTDSWPRYTADHPAGEGPRRSWRCCISERRPEVAVGPLGVAVCCKQCEWRGLQSHWDRHTQVPRRNLHSLTCTRSPARPPPGSPGTSGLKTSELKTPFRPGRII